MNTNDSPASSTDEDAFTRWAFNFFISMVGIALLGSLWMLVQMALA